MSRSLKKSPCLGIASHSDKQSKRKANRALRRKVNALLPDASDATVFPEQRETSNVWAFAKDGKMKLFGEKEVEKYLRK